MKCTGKAHLTITELGKDYESPADRILPGLYWHIENDDDVCGGNTSICNLDGKNLRWKGNPSGNGYGYFTRNRDLGQVFAVPPGHNISLDAIVLRTSRGNNAIRNGAPGSEMSIVFFEVREKESEKLRINENGTTIGDWATHGFDTQFNRCDDYIEGVEYIFLHHSTGGIFPDIEPTSRYVYDRGIALANTTTGVYAKEPAEFLRDANGEIVWGVRWEGNGITPPTMIGQGSPPEKK